MPAPIVMGAAAIAARLAAKKAAKEVAKKAAAKAAKKAASSGYGMGKKGLTISNDVRIKPSTSSSGLKTNPGAKQVINQNIKTASKTTKAEAKANARGLKAAQGPSLAKGSKKIDASSGAYERAITKMQAETNMILGSSRKMAYNKAAKSADAARTKSIEESKKILARAKAEKNAKTIAKATKKKAK